NYSVLGPFLRELKDTLGMGFGAFVGLMAPYVGVGLAAFGALSFLAGNPQGVEGIFKGGAMAATIGTVALPALGALLVAEGVVNGLGFNYSLIGKGTELIKGACESIAKIVGVAEANPKAPEKAINQGVTEVTHNVSNAVQTGASTWRDLTGQAGNVNDKIQHSNLSQNTKAWASRFTNLLGLSHTEKAEQRKNTSEVNQDRNK
ncbi:MAG: hypothetical protein AABY27_01920, partial [Pseudomonadota bacterium]